MSQKVSNEVPSIDPPGNKYRTDEKDPHSIVYVRPKYVHLSINDLDDAERLVLWAMRVWVKGFMRDLSLEKCILTRLNRPNAPEIFTEIDKLMSLYGSSAQHALDFRCPLCVSLSPDEYAFLLMISAAQAGAGDLVDAISREGLRASSTQYGNLIVGRLAGQLTLGGLQLSLRTYHHLNASQTPFLEVSSYKKTLH